MRSPQAKTTSSRSVSAHSLGIRRASRFQGFRSSFRDWAGNETQFPRELAEHALAHVIGDKAEQAYRRSDALARRRELMDAWARFCDGGAGENVLTFKRAASSAGVAQG
jgi:hypothetical protein